VGAQGREVSFAAVLEPVRAGSPPQVTDVQLAAGDEGTMIMVQSGLRTDRMTIPAGGNISVLLGR